MRAKTGDFAKNEKMKNKKCTDNGEKPVRYAKIANWKAEGLCANHAKAHILREK